MTPIYLNAYFFPVGTRVRHCEGQRSAPHEMLIAGGWLDNVLALYLPKQKKAFPSSAMDEATDEGDIPEVGIKAGVTTEPIFAIVDANDNATYVRGWRTAHSWAAEYMNEGDNRDLVSYIDEIYEDLLALGHPEPRGRNNPEAAFAILSGEVPTEPLDQVKEVEPIHFLTLWTVESHRDCETGIDEVEAFHYAGLGDVTQNVRPLRQRIEEGEIPEIRGIKEEINRLLKAGAELEQSARQHFSLAEKHRNSLRKFVQDAQEP